MNSHLVILNDFDAPDVRMIALMRPAKEGGFEWCYISRWKSLSRYRRWHAVGALKYVTPIEAFGVFPVVEQFPGDEWAMLRVERFAESVATYPDGMARRWQAPLKRRTGIRAALLAGVRRAVASLSVAPSRSAA